MIYDVIQSLVVLIEKLTFFNSCKGFIVSLSLLLLKLQACKFCKHCKKMKFSIKDFFTKCGQTRSFLWIWSHLLNTSLMENFIFFAVKIFINTFFTEHLRTTTRSSRLQMFFKLGAVAQRCSVKKVVVEISQNSQENSYTRVSFLINCRPDRPVTLSKQRSGTGVFLCILQNF